MTCSWSWAESWPQVQVLEGKSWLFQKFSHPPFRLVPGPHVTQGQDTGVEPTIT